MRLTLRTICVFLFVIILIIAYCAPTAEGGVIPGIKLRQRVSRPRHRSSPRYQVKKKTKIKTKTKIRYGSKRPSLIKKITGRG